MFVLDVAGWEVIDDVRGGEALDGIGILSGWGILRSAISMSFKVEIGFSVLKLVCYNFYQLWQ